MVHSKVFALFREKKSSRLRFLSLALETAWTGKDVCRKSSNRTVFRTNKKHLNRNPYYQRSFYDWTQMKLSIFALFREKKSSRSYFLSLALEAAWTNKNVYGRTRSLYCRAVYTTERLILQDSLFFI